MQCMMGRLGVHVFHVEYRAAFSCFAVSVTLFILYTSNSYH